VRSIALQQIISDHFRIGGRCEVSQHSFEKMFTIL